ncbi:MAG: phosphotransferase [Thermomicrobiales bacterium]
MPDSGVTTPNDDKRQRREERSRCRVESAVALARAHGLRVENPAVLNDLFSLMVHLRPAPVVARVATCMPTLRSPIADWLAREIEVTAYLEQQGVPVAGPSRELPPGPHEADGFPISFWTYVEPDPDRTVTAADRAAMLVDLHAVLRTYPGELPMLGANDIPRALEFLDQAGKILSETEVGRLRAAAERLRPLWETPGDDVQPLHGDVHAGNLIATRDGLVWIDFEDVWRGPVEWGMATVMDADAVAMHHRPDPEMLARCMELRALQVALVLIAFYDDFGDLHGWDSSLRGMIGSLPPAS